MTEGYERFQTPVQGEAFQSEYDIDSDEIQDLIERGVAPVKVFSAIDLSSAGTYLMNEPGYGFVFYAADSVTGAKYTDAYIGVAVNQGDASQESTIFPAKTGRGYRGAFSKLFLKWPADSSGTYVVKFYVFKSKQYPWIGGEEAS